MHAPKQTLKEYLEGAPSASLSSAPTAALRGDRWKRGAVFGLLAVFLLKYGKVLFLVLGKLLFVVTMKVLKKAGFTALKPGFATGFWMVAVAWLSWRRFGTPFLLGLAAFVVARRAGHALVARRIGVGFSPRDLVPVLGTTRLVRRAPRRVAVRAAIGAGGLLAGVAASVAALAAFQLGAGPLWLAVGHTGLVASLLLLAPFRIVDGGRLFRATPPVTGVAGLALVGGLQALGWVRNPLGWLLALLWIAVAVHGRLRRGSSDALELPTAGQRAVAGLCYVGLCVLLLALTARTFARLEVLGFR